jgi:FKBP-type peptidyl-prolyl cis-trans isomerase 2
MSTVQQGDTVKVHYTGTLEDGTQFDSSSGRDPLEFTVGAGQMIAGFDAAVRDMALGAVKTATFPPEQAYGPSLPDMIFEVPTAQIPDDMDPSVGDQLQMQNAQGHPVKATVTAVTDDGITLDANHDLAGKELTFEIQVVELNGKSA